MNPNETSIFERMLAGGLISFADPEYPKIFEEVSKTFQQSLALNTSTDIAQIREHLSEVIGQVVDESTTVLSLISASAQCHARSVPAIAKLFKGPGLAAIRPRPTESNSKVILSPRTDCVL